MVLLFALASQGRVAYSVCSLTRTERISAKAQWLGHIGAVQTWWVRMGSCLPRQGMSFPVPSRGYNSVMVILSARRWLREEGDQSSSVFAQREKDTPL